jgi:signal transduction histidine kinase
MNLSNWLYLSVGIALGIVFNRLSPKVTKPEVSENTETLLQQIEQTQMAYLMVQETCKFKAGFLARITHELRSPLNGLIGLHQLILSDLCENPAEEREFIAQAHERTLKLVKILDDILKVARTEYGTNELDIQPLQLAEILAEVENSIYLLVANRNLRLMVSLPPLEIQVLADYCWLHQILVNIVDNTIVQMEEGSIHISYSLEETSHLVLIWLDVPSHTVIWSEPVDLIPSQIDLTPEQQALSSGMKLMLNQILLELMGGKLEILADAKVAATTEKITRLQISIPRPHPKSFSQGERG